MLIPLRPLVLQIRVRAYWGNIDSLKTISTLRVFLLTLHSSHHPCYSGDPTFCLGHFYSGQNILWYQKVHVIIVITGKVLQKSKRIYVFFKQLSEWMWYTVVLWVLNTMDHWSLTEILATTAIKIFTWKYNFVSLFCT